MMNTVHNVSAPYHPQIIGRAEQLSTIGEHTWLTTAEDRESGEPQVEHEDNLIPWHDPDKAPLIPKAIGHEGMVHGKVIEEILEHKEVPGGMLYLAKWKGYTNEGAWIHGNALFLTTRRIKNRTLDDQHDGIHKLITPRTRRNSPRRRHRTSFTAKHCTTAREKAKCET
ncbi:hypothetical protein Pelo_12632 [Pelomyxa schiedti]|nr:hypothetical protein Pelo_12632 [Pelomyxa schiedti]